MTEHGGGSPVNGSISLATIRAVSGAISSTIAILAVGAFALSFFYNWGFFSALGISFDTAPANITDYAISWAAWLPASITFGFGVFVAEFWSSRKRGVNADRDRDEKSVSSEDERKHVRGERIGAGIAVGVGMVVLAVYAYDSDASSPFLLGLSLALFWSALVIFVLSFPGQKARYGKLTRNLIYVTPIFAILAFSLGCSKADSRIFGQHDVYRVHVKNNGEPKSRPIKVEIVRIFEKWMLICHENRKVGWIRLDRVDSFVMEKDVLSF